MQCSNVELNQEPGFPLLQARELSVTAAPLKPCGFVCIPVAAGVPDYRLVPGCTWQAVAEPHVVWVFSQSPVEREQ
jgi:hypothetical protein